MKKKLVPIMVLGFLGFNFSNAQQNIVANRSGEAIYYASVEAIDSIKFSDGFSQFNLTDDNLNELPINVIDSLTFQSNVPSLTEIYIIYHDSHVTIINP